MIKDLQYAFRMILKAPAFTAIAVLTLALGVGANSAIFSVVDTVLLRPLNFKSPEQIVMIWGTIPDSSKDVDSYPDYLDYRAQSQSFEALTAFTRAGAVLSGTGEAQLLRGLAVTAEIFDVLGMQPSIGRGYTRDEAKEGAPPVVVLCHPFWKRVFNGDPKVVGQQINLSGKSYTILGVMPPGWSFPVEDAQKDYLTPLEPLIQKVVAQRGAHSFTLVGRLKPTVSLKQAEAEMRTIAARLAQQYPDTNTDRGVSLVPLHQDVVGEVRPALMILLGAVALVLLIACANVANLLLARAAVRSREIGIRTALGASRTRIVRQLLAESFLLAILGGLGGLLLAWWAVDLLRWFAPRGVPRIAEIQVSGGVVAFTFLTAIVSTLIFGLVPALQVSGSNVSGILQQGAKGSTGGLQAHRIRAFLVVSQVSLSLLLLAGAGLLIRSFFNLRATDPGFDPTRVLVLEQSLPRVRYPESDQQRRFFEQLLPRLEGLPGVESVGGVNLLPFSGNSRGSTFTVAGQPPIPEGKHPGAGHLAVTAGYFETMRIPLRAGRTFDQRDVKDSPLVVVVNEAFARKFLLPNVNPIGQQVIIDRDDPNPPPAEVVGVVGDAKHEALNLPADPEFYAPFAQEPERRLYFAMRTASVNLAGMDAVVRRTVQEFDKDLFVPKLAPMETLLAAHLSQPRFNMLLLVVFAGVALVLAAIGIYGVIAYSVTQRTREIGIRMALGAQKGQMLKMMLRQSLALVVVGLVLGLLGAVAATRLLAALLYGVGANDLTTYAAVVALLGGAAFLASYIPARRAMRVDPMVALRHE